jgi:thymidylate synthase
VVEYRPYGERAVSTQYRDVLASVLADGLSVPTRQGPAALTLMQQTMRFPLDEGFPVITERSIKGFWRKAIGELCAFINGAITLVELEKFGCDWWGPWATPEKTLKKDRLAVDPAVPGPRCGEDPEDHDRAVPRLGARARAR